MKMETSEDCLNSILTELDRTRIWRTKLQDKYPADTRNSRAAGMLAKIAAGNFAEEQFEALKPYYRWDSPQWREVLGQAARSVGFQRNVPNMHALVECLVCLLEQQQATAA
jgi:hypothetical protein